LSDVGSGINFKCRNFQKLLEQALDGEIKEVVIAHKERFCRIGYELLEFMFRKLGIRIRILGSSQNTESERDNTQELSEDLISIVTIFVARHNGSRAAENRKRRRREGAAEEEAETSSKEARREEDC
jgi:predicted site-specific integrase-resolvase